ncbi:hypothetical protein AMTR_s00038p00066630 [Amborella trichopoda]|uniref:Uncharacterized protein n=1 Tax=Amborella trichopoda TaxID=13333 RepID=U5CN15_AMBTC|nr:hypothetical protein AMTR_s00038p00066630 [Amborella trichopoda]
MQKYREISERYRREGKSCRGVERLQRNIEERRSCRAIPSKGEVQVVSSPSGGCSVGGRDRLVVTVKGVGGKDRLAVTVKRVGGKDRLVVIVKGVG